MHSAEANAALLHRRICFCQAGNVVTGEMVEELILAGADIIKVGIGPGEGCIFGTNSTSSLGTHLTFFFGLFVCFFVHVSLRFCVHHPHEDRRGVPPAQCRDRVRRCSPRLGRPHHLREPLFHHKSGVWS